MNAHETLMCIGGPLSTRRVSVPAGVKWFRLADSWSPGSKPHRTADGIIALESLTADFGNELPETDSRVTGYVRSQFVSGEKGLVEVFSFRE